MRKSQFLTVIFLVPSLAFAASTPAPANVTLLKQQRAQAMAENDLITQLQAAEAAKDWAKAEPLAQKLVATAPDRWEYRQALANVRFSKGDFAGALEAYTAALASAGKAKVTPALKEAMATMYTNQGNAYLKLKRNAEAIQAYTQAAQLSAEPATALWNLCATEYNLGDVEGGLAACDKAIAADPARADAYFIKGSLLTGNAGMDSAGKVTAPPGAVEALQKYLELAPNGSHAADAKQMLDFLNNTASPKP